MTSTRAAVTARARALGVVAHYHHDREGTDHELLLDAPEGFVFASSGVHQLVCAGSDGTPWPELYADALERLADGLDHCDDDACDSCHPEWETSR